MNECVSVALSQMRVLIGWKERCVSIFEKQFVKHFYMVFNGIIIAYFASLLSQQFILFNSGAAIKLYTAYINMS